MRTHETYSRPSIASLVAAPDTLVGRIGNTPLIRIRNMAPKGASIYAKAEWLNPGGSIKDRAALSMLVEAEQSGLLGEGKTIIDASSGNTGIAYAMIAGPAGYQVTIALPANAGLSRQRILTGLGARLILTDPLEGTDGARQKVREMVASDPEPYYYPDQYNNPANWRTHYRHTAPEIWAQSGHRITHFVAGLGTTGTFVGTARRLKELNGSIRCISFEPDSPLHGIEGLKHLPTAIVPGIYDPGLADEHLNVSTHEAYAMVRRLAREEGLFVGPSSGAAMAVSLALAQRTTSAVIVTVFPDSGAKYLHDHPWT